QRVPTPPSRAGAVTTRACCHVRSRWSRRWPRSSSRIMRSGTRPRGRVKSPSQDCVLARMRRREWNVRWHALPACRGRQSRRDNPGTASTSYGPGLRSPRSLPPYDSCSLSLLARGQAGEDGPPARVVGPPPCPAARRGSAAAARRRRSVADGDLLADRIVELRANALHLAEILRARERLLGPILDDRLRLRRSDPGQAGQLGDR